MTPSHILVVMGFTRSTALGTGVLGTTVGGDAQIELMGALAGIKSLFHQFPGCRQAKAEGENIVALHGIGSF